MKKSFEELIYNLKDTIADYNFYTDFDKVFKNVKNIEKELNILNYLLGKKETFDEEFIEIIEQYPNVLKVIPILLAVRGKNIRIFDKELLDYNFDRKNKNNIEYLHFLERTGIKRLFIEEKVKNLVDYVTGVEAGLDSNARKNRTGFTMESLVYKNLLGLQLQNKGFKILKQANGKTIREVFKTDKLDGLISLSKNEKNNKVFDFAVLSPNGKIYLIETNFYSTQGSKLNETARSYTKLQEDIQKIDGVKFIWITDGMGWAHTKNNLRSAFERIEYLITLDNIEENLRDIILTDN